MAVKHAQVLDEKQFARLLCRADLSPHRLRDRAMLFLSYKAGLRAQEIAGLEWSAVCDADGEIRTDAFWVGDHIAKKGHGRSVSMNRELYQALVALRDERPMDTYIAYGVRLPRMSPNHVTVWFFRLYSEMGFKGCSSHSGRRTFITKLARRANLHDCSIKDVQLLAGHRRLETTEKYLEPSPNVGRLINAI